MINNQRIFDADTHVGPTMTVLEQYLDRATIDRLSEFEDSRRDNGAGVVTYTMGARTYERRLGDAPDRDGSDDGRSYMKGFKGAHREPPSPNLDGDPAARLSDMDREGVDVNFMLPSGWFGTWSFLGDVGLEFQMYEAYHRWMQDYCAAAPDRLTGVLLVSGNDVAASLEAIERHGSSRWPVALMCYTHPDMPLDHPDLEPIWAAAQEHDLTLALHTFTVMPPYAPGGRDTWDNLWLQRSAAHPWCGMRNMAAMIGSGVMDRYPDLRLAVLESGHGWLPFWAARLDEHVRTMEGVLPKLDMMPSEYVTSGRYFHSTEISEGAEITRSVIELLGPDVLMYGSDYPHSEAAYPESTEIVTSWGLPDDVMAKLMWDNAARCYPRINQPARTASN